MFNTQGNYTPAKKTHVFTHVYTEQHVEAKKIKRRTSYPDLFIIFDRAATFPVKAKAHEVNTQNTGQRFDACPLHCGSLRR